MSVVEKIPDHVRASQWDARLKKGDVVEFTASMPRVFLGKKAAIVRVSRATGGLTVKLVEKVSDAYVIGEEVNVHPYNVRRAVKTR